MAHFFTASSTHAGGTILKPQKQIIPHLLGKRKIEVEGRITLCGKFCQEINWLDCS
jgi:hypothetical protein